MCIRDSLLEVVELAFAQLFERHHAIAGVLVGVNELVELQMKRMGVTVLGVLDEEHHEKGHDRRAGVDDELPRVRVVEHAAGDRPEDDLSLIHI